MQQSHHYFKDTKSASLMKKLDAWIRRKIRCFRIRPGTKDGVLNNRFE